MIGSALFGLGVAALIGTPHCLGMCGGLAVAGGGRGLEQAAWHAGRIGTYATLGALAGGMGEALPTPGWAGAVAMMLLVVFAAALAGIVPEPAVRWPGLSRLAARLARRQGVLARFGFGATTGLLPCGLLYTALAVPVGLADPLLGALGMALFGLGTVPAMVLATTGLRRVVTARPWARKLLAAGVLASGLWSMGFRQAALADTAEGEVPACHDVGH